MADTLLSQSLGGGTKKKKRTVIVVKKLERKSPKKEVFVSRKIKGGEQLEESFMGNSSAQRPVKMNDGSEMLSRSILGDPKTFAMYDEHNDSGEDDVVSSNNQPGSRAGSRASSRAGTRKTIARANTVEVNPKEAKRNKKVAMVTDSQTYVDSLTRLKSTAQKLRKKEQEKEQNLLQYLPVNERFDLNKEGKVLAMWQERQKKWDQIQKGLSNKVGVRESNLLMSTGDDFRTRNEEYDLLQAAIPVHERFGSESWEMQLRGGTERAVTIGHIFSGLTCNVSVKRTTPATLRKPKKSRGPGKTTQFIDEFPSMKLRQKQLKKTLQTLRPHNLELFDVDTLIIGSRDLFDWAISSSEEYMNELQNDVEDESGDELSVAASDEMNKDIFLDTEPEVLGPQLSFETTRNILLNALQNETVKTTVTFKNTGSSVMEYSWKKVEMSMNNELAENFSKRKCIPREHELSEKRPVFFCSSPKGQILPGQTINTIFLFNSKGSGGYFNESWMLDTSPRAIVSYPNRVTRAVTITESPGGSDGKTSAQQPLPSVVYVKLTGHAMTLDENQHRRDAALDAVKKGCVETGVSDELYDSIRSVRTPITVDELNNRKLALFKSMNSSTILSECGCCTDEAGIHISLERYESFLNLAAEVSSFSEQIYSLERQRIAEAGVDATASDKICIDNPKNLLDVRAKLLPEVSIASFDEISEEMLDISWDLNLSTLSEEIERLAVSAKNIEQYEKLIEANRIAEEKKRISAEKRAADSDYESDDDEEEEEEEDEDDENAPPKIEHELVVFGNQLKDQLRKMYYALSMKSLPPVEDQIREAICLALDNYEDVREDVITNLHQKGKFEPPQAPNAFSEEGIAFWDDLLIPQTDTAEITRRAKAGYDKDPKRKFFIDMFEKISSSLLDNLAENLSTVDNKLEASVASSSFSSSAAADLANVAALRLEDVEQLSPTTPVFVGFNGDCFAAEPLKSAFDLSHLEQRLAVAPIITSAVNGAKKVLLIHESNAPFFADSLKSVAKRIQEVLTKEDAKLAEQRKVVEGKLKTYSVVSCATIPEVMYMLQAAPGGDGVVQVYYLDNLSSEKIVPLRREYVEELSDDDEAPIPMGLEESRQKKHSLWVAEGPEKVVTNITAQKKQHKVSCYTDAGFAIRELFQESQGVWVEASAAALLATPALSKVGETRVLSSRLRDMQLWISVMRHMPNASDILSPLLEEEQVDTSLFESEEEKAEKEVPPMDFSRFFAAHFPPSRSLNPKFVATVGGKLVPEKMKVLENLMDLANTVIICGEICIPFVACSFGVTFTKYTADCSDYSSLCGMILQKAKLRGVEVILPVDVMTGDEAVTSAQLQQCFENVDDSARDEGADYDGESSVFSVQRAEGQDAVVIKGYVYDIGPSTCELVSAAIASSQLHLSWGTAGCSEMSSFQAGQRAVVTASSPPPKPEDAILSPADEEPQTTPHNIVIGESNVEWWARISDPEGEFEGYLTKMGMADFVSGYSNAICSSLCGDSSHSLSCVVRRPPTDGEWDYLTALRHEDDEEEEEDDDDEDDEDED